MSKFTQAEAIECARELESILAPVGHHVALTGGCLYKEGPRKDADFVVYTHDWHAAKMTSDQLHGLLNKHDAFSGGYVTDPEYTGREVLLRYWKQKRIDLFILS